MSGHGFNEIRNHVCTDIDGGLIGRFRGHTVASVFQPIFSLSHSNPVGYEALCRPSDAEGRSISPLALFGQVKDESDNVLLDRLCRAIHIENFCKFADKSWIFLNVNPLITVLGKNYGAFFKEMLEHSNVPPSQVVVEILETGIYDESILSAAVNYYKNLGCLVAIDDFGTSHSNFDRVWNIQPDIVKFDRSIIVQAETNSVVQKALPSLVGLIQELGCIALVEGVETEKQALIAIDSNVDLVQGYYFGYPRSVLVSQQESSNLLSRLRDKHNEFSGTHRGYYREAIDQCHIEFKAMLKSIETGMKTHEDSCENILALHNVTRVYFLDENGYQVGRNLSRSQIPEFTDPRYSPLIEAADANWSRRYYFQQALLSHGEIHITRPYRSLVGKGQCITLSALLNTTGGKLVACVDLACPS